MDSWQEWTHSGLTTRTTIAGLRANTTYEVQVRARSGEIYGSWSGSRSGTTAPANRPATGQPTVSGILRVGETLRVDLSGIMDDDGLTNVLYVYQWLWVEGSTGSVIPGAPHETYTLTVADVGKQVQVRVTFTDAGGQKRRGSVRRRRP